MCIYFVFILHINLLHFKCSSASVCRWAYTNTVSPRYSGSRQIKTLAILIGILMHPNTTFVLLKLVDVYDMGTFIIISCEYNSNENFQSSELRPSVQIVTVNWYISSSTMASIYRYLRFHPQSYMVQHSLSYNMSVPYTREDLGFEIRGGANGLEKQGGGGGVGGGFWIYIHISFAIYFKYDFLLQYCTF